MTNFTRNLAVAVVLSLAAIPASAATTVDVDAAKSPMTALERQVRKELITLPFYSLFDHIQFQIEGNTVMLSGSVYRPSLKKSAERVLARVEGIENVKNDIEVLPTSTFDDSIRRAMLRTIYGDTVLSRYSQGSHPAIRIIVRNGDVTLEGAVINEGDKNLAGIRANTVNNVFKVTNNLKVARS